MAFSTSSMIPLTVTQLRRQVPWEKVPDVPRPSQVPPVFTAFGKAGKYGDDRRKPQPRTSNAALSKGVISVYPRRFPNPPPSDAPIPRGPLISRKYAPRRVRIAEEVQTQEVVEREEPVVPPRTSTSTSYTTNHKGPVYFYSTYYHA
ncbi:hypothetical protein J437_LFUL006172 [Ladona fulva]|uniref:Uncharacterized protein n=1 Tax=Ladona fulva TaxID=123851 RepID=A0A8K0K375_LADFU|nr:hypothetical protein J437_LFUL006172 [Ladona fulva]